jgi:hypothetical protein
MRKLLIFIAVLGSFGFSAVPASADVLPPNLPCTPTANGSGSATCTINVHPVTLPFFPGTCLGPIFASLGPLPSDLFANSAVTGNAVFHVIQNTATDFWITTTQEGNFVGLPPGFSGRATNWFGMEQNLNNSVFFHFITDGRVSGPGVSLSFHETGHGSGSANQTPNFVVFDKCSVS